MRLVFSIVIGLFLTNLSFCLKLSSEAFNNNNFIPIQYTCEGKNQIPALSWNDWPEKTKSFALIVSDPDAPDETFYHWLLYNIPLSVNHLTGDLKQLSKQISMAKNSKNENAYAALCPPVGKLHRYIFKLYALDTILDVSPKGNHVMLEKALQGHVLATAELLGTYTRSE